MQSGRFEDSQELRFQIAKRSDMGCAILLEFPFDDSQESSFQPVKRSSMGTTVLQGGRLATSQESRFQGRNNEILAELYSNMFHLLMSGISYTGC